MNLVAKAEQETESETWVPIMNQPLRKGTPSCKGDQREIFLRHLSFKDTDTKVMSTATACRWRTTPEVALGPPEWGVGRPLTTQGWESSRPERQDGKAGPQKTAQRENPASQTCHSVRRLPVPTGNLCTWPIKSGEERENLNLIAYCPLSFHFLHDTVMN